MTMLHQFQDLLTQGQSIWYDFISRDFINSGHLARLVEMGVRGMTSNPTIFEKAIGGGGDYDEQIRSLALQGFSVSDIGQHLFVTDIINACNLMRPVYDASGGQDGFISLEVNPKIAADTEATYREARVLWSMVDCPNLMIKIPATPQGVPAVRRAIADGLNVNVTLMFSLDQYRAVAEAYIAGLEDRLAAGHPIDHVNSVASVFVSRIDSMIDDLLNSIGTDSALALRGKAGIANTKLTYQQFTRLFSGDRWERLAAAGARVQRPLWASTSTKNPDYPTLMYVDNLIGPHTVNTVPPETLTAILSGITVARTVDQGLDEAEQTMHHLAAAGVDLNQVMDRLLDEGVRKFEASFDTLMSAIENKSAALSV